MLVLLASLIVGQSLAIAVYFDDRRSLINLLDRITSPALPPSEQVKMIIRFLRDKPAALNDSYFLLPIFRFMRPTARQVAEQGGDCADRSRLLIRLLQLRNIKASKWALYSRDLRPQHAAVEVEVETGKMAVDPLFGLWFPHPYGGYYGINELKDEPSILQERIRYLRSRGEQPGVARLEEYPLDEYIYENARTINWDKSIQMQLLYLMLHWMVGQRINEIPRPAFVEEPAWMVVIGLIPLEAVILIAWLLAVRSRNAKRAEEGRSRITAAGHHATHAQ